MTFHGDSLRGRLLPDYRGYEKALMLIVRAQSLGAA